MKEQMVVCGVFNSNKRGVIFEIVVSIFMIICFVLTLSIPFLALFFLVIFIVAVCNVIKYYKLKDQEITVTTQRVYGKLYDDKIELPLDMISHVEARGKKSFAIFTASGSIVGQCCENRDEIVSAISSLLKERTSNALNSFEKMTSAATQATAVDEIRRYKQLFDEGVITEEEFEMKKKQLLGL